MIFVYHNNTNVVTIESEDGQSILFDSKFTIAKVLSSLAQQFKTEKLVWCNCDYKGFLNKEALSTLFHHDKLVMSYRPGLSNYFGKELGYADESLFVSVNKKVSFPTWQMSSTVGVIHASILDAIKDLIPFDADFDYYLNSLAKLGMPLGLLCYSEPQLLKEKSILALTNAGIFKLFRFVKQHYRMRWIFLLLLNLMVYERKFSFLPFLFSFFYKNRSKLNIDFNTIKVQSSRKATDKETVDVVIPTIGRSSYLYDVLQDLKKQTHLPENVIVVEQNPDEESKSDLGYLTNEIWPFAIKHTFTHQAGVCNARNTALEQINSEWVFFADDDIRIEADFIQQAFEQINKFGVEAVSFRCFQKEDKKIFSVIFQWMSFGSGCSLVSSAIFKNCKFQMGYEFGFGEDADFGMQLRNQGQDILYLPEPEILHLKAPVGGFRTKPILKWQNDSVQPKPSPTVMLYQILHNSSAQIKSYKTTLFFKYYRLQKIKNPVKYYLSFQKQWKRSVFWANELNKKQ